MALGLPLAEQIEVSKRQDTCLLRRCCADRIQDACYRIFVTVRICLTCANEMDSRRGPRGITNRRIVTFNNTPKLYSYTCSEKLLKS
jgi:hypothetical protein